MSFLDRLFRRRGGGDEPGRPGLGVDPDAHEPGQPDDPRGGIQSEDYRTADPRDVVEQGGTMMAGPGGTPQDAGPADHPEAAGLEEPEQKE